MSTAYILNPPFLVVPEENDFADMWEAFCCKMLQLAQYDSKVYRRSPPESGVDLYDPSWNIAYQCKSVESGKSGDFRPDAVIESIRDALKVQQDLNWKSYVICVNVNPTGTAESKIKAAFPNLYLMIYGKSYWVHLCERFSNEVIRNFRKIQDINQNIDPSMIPLRIQRLENEADELRSIVGLFDRKVFSAQPPEENPFEMYFAIRETRIALQKKRTTTIPNREARQHILIAKSLLGDVESKVISQFSQLGSILRQKTRSEYHRDRWQLNQSLSPQERDEAINLMISIRIQLGQHIENVQKRLDNIDEELTHYFQG